MIITKLEIVVTFFSDFGVYHSRPERPATLLWSIQFTLSGSQSQSQLLTWEERGCATGVPRRGPERSSPSLQCSDSSLGLVAHKRPATDRRGSASNDYTVLLPTIRVISHMSRRMKSKPSSKLQQGRPNNARASTCLLHKRAHVASDLIHVC